MEETKLNEMIHAYTAGCLDYDEMIYFIDNFKFANVNRTDLGELQNVMSFLPAILELEKPSIIVKDEIAKRLYKYESEILTKERIQEEIISEDKNPPTYFEEPDEPQTELLSEEEETIPREPEPNILEQEIEIEQPTEIDFEFNEETIPADKNEIVNEENNAAPQEIIEEEPVVNEEVKIEETDNVEPESNLELDSYYESEEKEEIKEQPEKAEPEEKPDQKELLDNVQFQELKEKEGTETPKEPSSEFRNENQIASPFQYLPEVHIAEFKERQNYNKIIAFIIIVLFLSLGSAGLIYYYFTLENEKSQQDITLLKNEVDGLNQELIRLNKVQRVLSLLGSKEVWSLNLNGTVGNPTGFGKIIIDFPTREGLLQLYNMPRLEDKTFYHLWLNCRDTTISLGSFTPQKDVEYIPLSEIPVINPVDINSVAMTLEDTQDIAAPKGTEFLSTVIKQRRGR